MLNNDNLPNCFGILDEVFPLQPDGLRLSPGRCIKKCNYKTQCLKKAMKGKDGLKTQEQFVDRSYKSGMIGFLERWSQKKHLRRGK